jgi:hypothetical protein
MDYPRKSSYSNSGNCVEIGSYNGASDGVGVRDTMQAGQPGRTEVNFPAAAWRAFTGSLKEG